MEKQQKGEQTQARGQSQHKTGASNLEYDLFSEAHSLLKGNAALEQYMEDARQAGDREAESTFKAIHDQNQQNVGKIRDLIEKHIKTT